MPHRKSNAPRHAHASKTPQMPPPQIDDVDLDPQSAEASARPDGELRQQMVAEAAYYRALNRGFNGGDPNDDWYEAVREIDERLNDGH